MTATADLTIAVLPGTGKTGRRIVQRLRDAGATVRAGSRRGTPPFDWTDEANWRAHLEGADAAYVTYIPDIAVPGADRAVGRLAALAAEAGLTRLVLLVGRGQRNSEAAEASARAAFPATTVLRASWFMQEFSEGSLHDMVLGGVVALPVGDVPEPFVDVDDVADVAVAALVAEDHAGRTYEITGPEALTFAEVAAAAGAAAGRPVRLEVVALEAFCAGARADGTPEETVDVLAHLFGELLDGRNAEPQGGVEAVLGRQPADAATAMRREAQAGAWT